MSAIYSSASELALNILVSTVVGYTLGLILKKHRGRRQAPYSERLNSLTKSLVKSSKDIDSILQEVYEIGAERQNSIKIMESELASLSEREQEIRERIKVLESIPVPVAEHFAKMMESGEKRSAKRDYLLFGAGVVTSILSAIALKLLGLA